MIMESKAVIPNSAGSGKYRGGFGQCVTFRATGPIIFSIVAARILYPPEGLLGGSPGRGGKICLNSEEIVPGDGQLLPGDVIAFESPGGGGLHPPTQRAVGAVIEDVQDGLVSIQNAASDYGVVINSETLEADLDATEKLRALIDGNDEDR